MAYLMDFIEFLSSDARKKEALVSPEYEEWEKLRVHCDMMLERGIFTAKSSDLSDPEKRVLKKEKRLLNTIWKKYQYVPYQMNNSALGYRETDGYGHYTGKVSHYDRNNAYTLHYFSEYSQVKLADIREAAMKLSYMILPVCYVNKEAVDYIIKKELLGGSYSTSNVVRGINTAERELSEIEKVTEQDLYVLCPVSFYDLCRAEEDNEQREVIFGGELVRVKALLDTITQIQRNLFAILRDDEGDTRVWEIEESGECSESELTHLRILVETIMPIQRSLLKIARKSKDKDMEAWEKTMRSNHREEIFETLRRMSKQLSWSEEAAKVLKKTYSAKIKDAKEASFVIAEAAAVTDVLIFSVPRGTSVVYGDELATVFGGYGVGMPESFYLKRGFVKCSKKEHEFDTSEIGLSF